MGLQDLDKKEESKNRRVFPAFLLLVFALFLILGILAVGSVTYAILHDKVGSKVESAEISDFDDNEDNKTLENISITTYTSIIPTTSISTTYTSIIPTSTTSTSSTTTTLCGGVLQEPCENGCKNDLVINAEGLCQPVFCTPPVPSGKEGCGAFALNFCKNTA